MSFQPLVDKLDARVAGAPGDRAIAKRDLVPGTLIAVTMGVGFWLASHGASLKVTFIPGVVATWLLFVWCYRSRLPLPTVNRFLPAFCCVLAVQFVHFTEEFVTGFRTHFAELYGGAPYSNDAFVSVNMSAYAVMIVACVIALTTRLRFAIVPAIFFIFYGAIGNAIAHTWWSIMLGAYFPGLITAQLYWIAGPYLLYKLVGDRRVTAIAVLGFAVVLIPLLALAADTAAA
ncbi:HXXEE domain-containing protein [Mycobacterium sp. 1165196.3]|uniref:HXXEE domain-containing protein n=1 Tax=Mycobacterium sp. 1165196.3 TaxID=1834071 RepID=UPI0009EDB494|nr:HXXEE domain-containing protein [Mycobacterium sp. 1165196.3]